MTSKLFRYGLMVVGVATLLVGFQNFSGGSGKKVQMEGELEVLHIHNIDKTSHYEYSLIDKSGKKTKLKFNKGKAPDLVTGTKIRVSGEESNNILALDDSGSSSLQVLAAPEPNTFGEQKTIVILVNFSDNPIQPYTVDQATTTVFGASSDFMRENSYGQAWLAGKVAGWYTLPIVQTCSPNSISVYADQAAKAAGVDLSLYPRRIYVIPRISTCTWSGLGTVGGNPSSTWVNGNFDRGVVSHEMGHNLGLYHSHSLDCGVTTLGSSCSRSDYGDLADTMGSIRVHFNPFQKERLGWLNYGNSPPIATIEGSGGTFTLTPYAAASGGTKALKILKGIDATTGQKSWYYVEFRQAIGFDSFLSGYPAIMSGVMVRTGTDGNGDTSDLLDMSPNSASGGSDWVDSPLAVGSSYHDSAAGVTISLLSVSSSGASVSVSIGGVTPTPSCVRANPSVTLSPSTSASVAPGTAVSYSVSVKNNDGSGCAASSFNLTRVVPSGWSSSLSISSLSLSPGASGSATLTVTSATTAVAGSYSISASAVNSSATSYSGSASASYSVASVASLSASVVTSKSTYLKGDSVVITASVSSGGVAVSGASVSFMITKPDGSVVTASAVTDASGKAIYKMRLSRKASAGTYQVRINATSGGQSASAITSFGVQ